MSAILLTRLTVETTKTLICASVLSKMDYCNSLAAHFTFSVDYRKFRTLRVQTRTDYKLSTLCHNFLTHLLPISLTSQCTPLPGSLVLLQTHRYFVFPVLKQKPLAYAVSPTALQSNGIRSLLKSTQHTSKAAFLESKLCCL